MSEKLKQEERVLLRLRQGPITPLQALNELGVMRLASVVHRLRKKHDIQSHLIRAYNRHHENCVVSEYKLIKENAWSSSELTPVSAAPSQPSA